MKGYNFVVDGLCEFRMMKMNAHFALMFCVCITVIHRRQFHFYKDNYTMHSHEYYIKLEEANRWHYGKNSESNAEVHRDFVDYYNKAIETIHPLIEDWSAGRESYCLTQSLKYN